MLYLYVALILLVETTALSMLKKYRLSSRLGWFALGYLLYMGVCVLLIQTFKFEDMGIVNVLWSAFSVLAVVIVGHLGFGESITRREIAGIAMVILGVALLPSS